MVVKLVRFLRRRRAAAGDTAPRNSRPALLKRRWGRAAAVFAGGFCAGLLAGLLAIGGGLVAVPVLAGLLGVPIASAVGTSVFQIVFTAAAGTWASLGKTELDWTVIGLLLVGSIPGAMTGPWLLKRTVERFGQGQPAEAADKSVPRA